jgi:hypothetical protein
MKIIDPDIHLVDWPEEPASVDALKKRSTPCKGYVALLAQSESQL